MGISGSQSSQAKIQLGTCYLPLASDLGTGQEKAMAPHSSTLSCLENPMDRGAWQAAVHGVAKSQTRLSGFTFTFHFHALEKEMATHSSVLAWRIPWTRETGWLQSMGSHRVGHVEVTQQQQQQQTQLANKDALRFQVLKSLQPFFSLLSRIEVSLSPCYNSLE